MDSQATPPTKSFIGRGPNFIPKAPTNPDDRTMIEIRPFPHDKYVLSLSNMHSGFYFKYYEMSFFNENMLCFLVILQTLKS